MSNAGDMRDDDWERREAAADRRQLRRGLLIYLGAVAIACGFAYLDSRVGCAFFQRGGAALVIYAILLSVLSLRARAAYGDELHAIQLAQSEIAQMMYEEEHEARPDTRLQLSRKIAPKLKQLRERLSRMVDTGRRFQELRVVEGPILMIGTFIWGFGDLLLRTPGCALAA